MSNKKNQAQKDPTFCHRETANGTRWLRHGEQVHLFRWDAMVCDPAVHPSKEEWKADSSGPMPSNATFCEKCIALAKTGDFIDKEVRLGEPSRRHFFPTLLVHGTGCHGMTGFFWKGITINRPDVAIRLALMEHARGMHAWDNHVPEDHACDCKAKLEEMGNVLEKVGVVSDTGWKGTTVGRCITDYTRRIQVKEKLSMDQIELLREYLIRNDCPGWTGMGVTYAAGGNEYVFTTTMDSSD